MLSGIIEKYEIHGLVRERIVLDKGIVRCLLKLRLVPDLFVSPIRHAERSEDVAEEEATELI